MTGAVDDQQKAETRYLLREGHFFGAAIGGFLAAHWLIAYAAWMAVVCVLWLWSLARATTRRRDPVLRDG